MEAFISIGKYEGIKGFYKGLGPSLVGVSHVAIQFPLYERLKTTFSDKSKDIQILFASSISKMIASSITYPHEVWLEKKKHKRDSN